MYAYYTHSIPISLIGYIPLVLLSSPDGLPIAVLPARHSQPTPTFSHISGTLPIAVLPAAITHTFTDSSKKWLTPSSETLYLQAFLRFPRAGRAVYLDRPSYAMPSPLCACPADGLRSNNFGQHLYLRFFIGRGLNSL